MRPLAPWRAALVAALLLLATPAGAQFLTRPEREWRTLATPHFDVHFPAEFEPWVREMGGRLEAVHASVSALVGYAPERRITVLVEDPSSASNGFALPFRDRPVLFLWPTPPDPATGIGTNRGWGEILAVHEYAHLAHLMRPSRNPRQRLLWRLLPVELGPVARRAPRWVTEGYATLVEGQLTGSGRPNSAARAAVLRQWALEGQLPTYAQLDGSRSFQGGAMAYLAGSAFLEWLQARAGDSSLVHLWRRMTARRDRSFEEAFAGVFGAPPAELYGRFTATLTGQALAVQRALDSAGLAEGTLVQRRSWGTGEPALSADGRHAAITLRERERPGRLVIWPADSEPESPRDRARREEALRRDPEDVPAVRTLPGERRALATLRAVNGAAYDQPRFLPDGERVLAVRWVPRGDGSVGPDLFEWHWRTGAVRQVTHGAGLRAADPAPDGRVAAGVRCAAGVCDLVLVELASGQLRPLAAGAPSVVWHRPRWSPDGTRIVASVQREGRWRLVVVPVDGGPARELDAADSTSRYTADWTPDGRALVATSEAGGIPHLVRVDAATDDERPLTRTTGAHTGVEVGPDGEAWFLALHARGLDVRAVRSDAPIAPARPLPDSLAPAIPPPATARDTFTLASLPPSRPYALGPRWWRVLPGASASPEGVLGTLMVANVDPASRLSIVLQGGGGAGAAWRGAAVAAAWRGWLPTLTGEAFATRQRPTALRDGHLVPAALDAEYAGGHLAADVSRGYARMGWNAALGVSTGTLEGGGLAERGTRTLGYGEVGARLRLSRDRDAVSAALLAHGGAGRTGGEGWARIVATASLGARVRGATLAVRGEYGEVDAGAPAYERLVVGGGAPPFFDRRLLDQRLHMPVLPPGTLEGARAATLRVSTTLFGAVEPYYWIGSGSGSEGDLDRWHRVIGAEYAARFPTIGFVRLPGVDVRVGAGYSLDEPYRDRLRAYASVVYRP